MKKVVLKLKIIMTNIARVIMSFLFVNLGSFFQNGVQASQRTIEPTCYIAGHSVDEKVVSSSVNLEKVFIIAVPIILVIVLISFVIIKIKKSKKKEKDNKENSYEKNNIKTKNHYD